MTHRPLKLGTRRSPLAMAQAEEARDRLLAAHPGLAVEIVPVTASGDRVTGSLADAGGKALWTKELDAWLLAGTIDFAVHSAKDVETIRPDGIAIAAVLPREDVRDVLVGVASLSDLPPGARIGTSAPRRAALALHQRPDCEVVTFRGNIQTRLAKLAAGEADATLLALAGLNRTGQSTVGTPLDPGTWIPAPGQGCIAIECRADDEATRATLAAIDDAVSNEALHAERRLLAALGGNCHSPVAAVSDRHGDTITLRAALFSPDGQQRVDGSLTFPARDADGPAALAADLLARAAPAIAEHFAGPQGD
ncbi:hydroxymethylbilane synthase [Novosphingobium kunmingense]|uniref:Porphobilinogen deaminase n=1 Tax=Novosphingobium kunmingense TaxID=1211806 RepID=A0A2N0H666_9SPHN|nr:hydroxymethylbilane synthase [Novosphingobium kunmingense]PKB14434.1 hydroxymethylbilane synthase [Novosphingobium kunmingense]